jgi:hypothetical protein
LTILLYTRYIDGRGCDLQFYKFDFCGSSIHVSPISALLPDGAPFFSLPCYNSVVIIERGDL